MTKHDGRTKVRVEPGQGVHQFVGESLAGDSVGCLGVRVPGAELSLVDDELGPPAAPSQPVESLVRGDPFQPRAKGSTEVERLDRIDSAQQRVLRDVLGGALIVKEKEADPISIIPEPADESFGGSRIALGHGTKERGFGGALASRCSSHRLTYYCLRRLARLRSRAGDECRGATRACAEHPISSLGSVRAKRLPPG